MSQLPCSSQVAEHVALSPLNSASPHYQIERLSSTAVMLDATSAALRYDHGMLSLNLFSPSIGCEKNTLVHIVA